MTRHRQFHRRGFTLAESLFAMTIVSFVLLAIIGMMPNALSSLQDAERRAAETRIWQTIAADLEGRSWHALEQLSTDPEYASIRYYDARGLASRSTASKDVASAPAYAVRLRLVNVVSDSHPLSTKARLPGEGSPSPFLRYVRIAISRTPEDTAVYSNLTNALNGTPVPLVDTFTVTLANLEPERPLGTTP